MSYQYSVTERRKRTSRAASPNFSGFRTGSSSSHSTFGYWVPLVLTVGAAAVGIAAWVWSARDEDDEDSIVEEQYSANVQGGYASMSGGVAPGPPGYPPSAQGFPPGPGPEGAGGAVYGGAMGAGMGMPPNQGGFQGPPQMGPPGQGGFRSVNESGVIKESNVNYEDPGLMGRMTSALGMGRSSSPANQTFDWASKKVVAGVAAAGAMAGAAMKSMGVSGEDDAERWSEEAESREPKMGIRRQGTADEFFSGAVEIPRAASLKTKKRRSVAVVVSAADSGSSDLNLGHHAVSAFGPKNVYDSVLICSSLFLPICLSTSIPTRQGSSSSSMHQT